MECIMSGDSNEPTRAQLLAGIVTKTLGMGSKMATVQRSHRFPLHIYTQIENLAQIGNVPVSVIINELLECGLEALSKELPPEIVKESKIIREDLSNQKYPNESNIVHPNKKPKLKSVKKDTEK